MSKRYPFLVALQKGDAVVARGTITSFNVGGEVEVDFGYAYGSPSGRVWVSRCELVVVEPLVVRMRRSLALWLLGVAKSLSKDVAK